MRRRGRPTSSSDDRKTSPARGAKAPATLPRTPDRRTLDAILDATENVLAEVGMEEITTDRIAEHAGISRAVMQRYFPTKPAVLAAWEERAVQRDSAAFARLADVLVETAPPLDVAIARVVREGVAMIARYASFYPGAPLGEVLRLSPARITEKETFVDLLTNLVASTLSNAREKARLVTGELELAARVALDMIVLLTLSAYTRPPRDEGYDEEIVSAVVRYFLGVVRPAEPLTMNAAPDP